MRKIAGFCMLILLSWTTLILAQTEGISVSFVPVFGENSLELEKYYPISENDSVMIEGFKWYISQVALLQNGESVWEEPKSYHLLEVEKENTLAFSLPVPPGLVFNQLRFSLGIDSLTNVSGAMGGDLDPSRGMYWTWQSGYINLKLEGRSNLCQNRNHEFGFHLGGYDLENNALQTLVLPVNEGRKIAIRADIQPFLSNINLTKQAQTMSPGKEAVLLSQKAKTIFGQ